MSRSIPEHSKSAALDASDLLQRALDVLDAIDAPGNIGAHVDLAICQLREAVEGANKTN